MMIQRLLLVSFISLAAFAAGLGLLCIKTFSLLGWLILSAEIFAGIAIFFAGLIGVMLGYAWVFKADNDESFLAFSKSIIESLHD